jgi:hypothetical protein
MDWKEKMRGWLLETPPDQANEVRLAEGPIQLSLQLADWDRLGCSLARLEMKPQPGSRLNLDPAQIEEKITYLEERLKVIEIEEARGKAVLRSAPPQREGKVLSFFEMALDPTEGLSLVRYAYDREQGERSLVSTALTRIALERLLTDLIHLAKSH